MNKSKFSHSYPLSYTRLLEDSRDLNVTYEKFCNRIATAAYSNQLAYKKRQQERKPRPYDPDNNKPKDKNKKPRSSGNPGKSKTSGNTGKPLSEIEKKAYWKAGTCFNCGKTGYKASDYPDKKKVVTVEIAENSSSSDESEKSEVKIKPKKPEPYDGKGNVQNFLTQARVYLRFERVINKADKILTVAAFLKGDALNWFKPTLRDYLENGKSDQQQATRILFQYYINFEEKLKANFGNPDEERTAAQKILDLKQKGPASKYAVTFKNLMAKVKWVDKKDDSLIDIFYKGLKDDVKDEIVKMARPTTLDKYIAKAVKIDNRQYKRRQERRGQFIPRPRLTGANQTRKRNAPSTAHGTAPEPMELRTAQKKDWSQIRCYNCNKMGHVKSQYRAPRKQQHHGWTPVPEGQPRDKKAVTFGMVRKKENPDLSPEMRKGLREAKALSQAAITRQRATITGPTVT
ncbi:hypothetical protein DL767_006941 [Monosporascus sp. MG133]|nr:hypothetical protein DL767_006941 [Monosporascus sp. MG133]